MIDVNILHMTNRNLDIWQDKQSANRVMVIMVV